MTAPARSPMLIVTALNAALLAALHALFASVVSEPYMDEPFHVRALSASPQPRHSMDGAAPSPRQ